MFCTHVSMSLAFTFSLVNVVLSTFPFACWQAWSASKLWLAAFRSGCELLLHCHYIMLIKVSSECWLHSALESLRVPVWQICFSYSLQSHFGYLMESMTESCNQTLFLCQVWGRAAQRLPPLDQDLCLRSITASHKNVYHTSLIVLGQTTSLCDAFIHTLAYGCQGWHSMPSSDFK